MAPTPVIAQNMASFISEFRDHGGSVKTPPHESQQRLLWIAAAKTYREAWGSLPAIQRTPRLREGLGFMWAAVSYPRCIVALLNLSLVAALSYELEADRIEVQLLGSRQVEEARGAGMAIQLALAEEAERRELHVHSTYTDDARNFHLKLGRRLDLVAGEKSSEWTLEDCRFLVKGINEAL